MFKGISNFGVLLRQAQQMGDRLQEARQQLQARRVTGTAGGGMVSVHVNGLGQVLQVQIESALVEGNEREMIEDLTVAAVNDALEKAKQVHMDAMKDLAQGLDLPGLESAFEKLAGLGPSAS